MILNAAFFHNQIIFPKYSDFTVELYPSVLPVLTPNCSPSPSLSKSSSSPKSTVSQLRERRVFDLPCAVCASPATGYHYNVASCNGCKTFFRRCVLSESKHKCIRSDNMCLADIHQINGARIKCRSCRFDRCVEQGMRKEAVTSGLFLTEKKAADIYLASISQPSTSSNSIDKVNRTVITLRQTLQLIAKFRKCNIRLEEIDLPIQKLLEDSFLTRIRDYQEIRDISNFKRDLPEWLTVDLLCSIEFVRQFEEFQKFCDEDKLELIRTSCFTIAIAIQALESFTGGHQEVVMPDGTNVIQAMINSGTVIQSEYKLMFIGILDPLKREKFTINELGLALQLLFFTIAHFSATNMTVEGRQLLEKSKESCMRSLLVHLIIEHGDNFTSRFGALTQLNEVFIKVTHLHKQKMQEGEPFREKLRDLLIEQCVFGHRLN